MTNVVSVHRAVKLLLDYGADGSKTWLRKGMSQNDASAIYSQIHLTDFMVEDLPAELSAPEIAVLTLREPVLKIVASQQSCIMRIRDRMSLVFHSCLCMRSCKGRYRGILARALLQLANWFLHATLQYVLVLTWPMHAQL